MWNGVDMTPHHSVTFLGKVVKRMGGATVWGDKGLQIIAMVIRQELDLLEGHMQCLFKMLLDKPCGGTCL